jgi:ATP-dependent exoDNAse (exonuclease V) beta subunit
MRRAAKVDSTSKALTALARQLGAQVLLINGVIDAVVYYRGITHVVDFKSPKGHLTPAQQRLVIDGFPLKFVSNEAQLKELLGV